MHWPGIEPGARQFSRSWQCPILPLNHQCLLEGHCAGLHLRVACSGPVAPAFFSRARAPRDPLLLRLRSSKARDPAEGAHEQAAERQSRVRGPCADALSAWRSLSRLFLRGFPAAGAVNAIRCAVLLLVYEEVQVPGAERAAERADRTAQAARAQARPELAGGRRERRRLRESMPSVRLRSRERENEDARAGA